MHPWLSLKGLARNPWRTLSAVVGIAAGGALYLTVLVTDESVLAAYKDRLASVTGQAELVVRAAASPWMREAVLEQIERSPFVKHALPVVQTRARVRFAGREESDVLDFFGIDLLDSAAVRNASGGKDAEKVIADPLSFMNHRDSVVFARGYAARNKVSLGDTIVVSTPKGLRPLVVRALMPDKGLAEAYGGAVAVLDIDVARSAFSLEGETHRIDLLLASGAKAPEVAAELGRTLGAAFIVEEPEARAEAARNDFRSFQALVQFLGAAGLLIAWVLVAGTLNVSVAERRGEIGALRALGATRGQVLSMILGETFFLGVSGALVGLAAAWGLSHLMMGEVARSFAAQALVPIPEPRLTLGAPRVFEFLFGVTFGALTAGLAPAWRATLVTPVEAMRDSGNGAEPGMTGMPSLSFLPLLGELAFQNVGRRLKRSATTIILLGTALAFVVVIDVMTESFRDTMAGYLVRTFTPDLVIIGQGEGRADQRQTIHEDFRREVESVRGVQAAFGQRLVPLEYEGKQLSLRSYDDLGSGKGYSIFDTLDRPAAEAGAELYGSADFTVLVSEAFRLRFGKGRGDTLDLATPTGAAHARIIGVINEFTSSNGAIYTSRAWYRRLWNDPLLSGVGVVLKPGADRAGVQATIRSRYAVSKNIEVLSDREYRGMVMDLVSQAIGYVKALRWAALLIALVALANAFMVEIQERWRELGALRAIGLAPRQLYLLLGGEALLKAALASLFAVALGLAVAKLGLDGYVRGQLGWAFHLQLPWRVPALCAALAALVSLAAVAGPARRAVRLEVGRILCGS